MFGGLTREHERWAEILVVERQHGQMVPAVIEERIRTLSLAGDEAGVLRWRDLAARYDQLRGGTMQ